jgi:hypothetical protein
MIPAWLHILSIVALAVGACSSLAMAVDVVRHPRNMGVMNLVWPLCGLFGGPLVLWAYYRWGRASGHGVQGGGDAPFAVKVGKGALHCGSGCTLGDIVAEWLAFFVPTVAVWAGLGWLFSEKMFAVWVVDFIFAFAFGIVFQYFAIQPMRQLGVREGIVAALKADTLSLTAWQIGMYGFMAIAHFWLFGAVLGARLETASFEFWFMMQIAMICGFITAYPVNWWLIRSGIKEEM